jgi:transcription elongation factor Elf1
MPYKDAEKRRAFRREWYAKNSKSEKAHVKKRKLGIRKWFWEYKSKLKCLKCGEGHVATIDFHHSVGDKEQSISELVANGYSIKRIEKELKKCRVLCSNCHRKAHFGNIKFKT